MTKQKQTNWTFSSGKLKSQRMCLIRIVKINKYKGTNKKCLVNDEKIKKKFIF